MADAELDLVGRAEAEEILGIDRATVVRWAQSGKLRVAHRMSGETGAYLFHRADVEALAQAAKAEAAS